MDVINDNAGGLDGLGQLRALLDAGIQPPIADTMGFALVQIEPGLAVFEGEPGRPVYNPIGSVHGGYAATLLDSACGCAVHSRLTADQGYTTLELKVSYHCPLSATSGLVRAEGRLLSFGRRAASRLHPHLVRPEHDRPGCRAAGIRRNAQPHDGPPDQGHGGRCTR